MKKNIFRSFLTYKSNVLASILVIYLVVGYFFPLVGFTALICMLAPFIVAIKHGTWWCENVCPRGQFFERIIDKYSPHHPVPRFIRSRGFQNAMLVLVFIVFGILMYVNWGDWNAIGMVFWKMVLITTIVGIVLAFIYAPRTWCAFCPMGTLASCVAPKDKSYKAWRKRHSCEKCEHNY